MVNGFLFANLLHLWVLRKAIACVLAGGGHRKGLVPCLSRVPCSLEVPFYPTWQ